MDYLRSLAPDTCRSIVRRITPHDLAPILDFARQFPVPLAATDWPTLLRSNELIGWLAEGSDRIVGLALGLVELGAGPATESFLQRLAHRLRGERCQGRPTRCRFLGLFLDPVWSCSPLEQALLGRLERELRQDFGVTQVIVPERALTMQLLLRKTGYRAVACLHGYCGEEDDYLMAYAGSPALQHLPRFPA
jgi:hypothetical protein